MTGPGLASWLQHTRRAIGLTASELADIAAVQEAELLAWEAGDLAPDENAAAALAGALGVTPAEVIEHVRAPGRGRTASLLQRRLAQFGFSGAHDLFVLTEVSRTDALLNGSRLPTPDEVPLLAEGLELDSSTIEACISLDAADSRVSPGPTLAERRPELVGMYDADNPVPVHALRDDTGRPARWRCRDWPQHTWVAPVSTATASCPVCLKAPPDNLLATHPDLCGEWSEANAVAPTEVDAQSKRKVAWTCPEDPSHRWWASPAARLSDGLRCPACSSVLSLRPDLAREWHRDNRHPAAQVPIDSTRPVLWRCRTNTRHVWACSPLDRDTDARCPLCAGRRRPVAPPLSAYPAISVELVVIGGVTADVVPADDDHPRTWRCVRDHRWTASTAARTLAGTGCPICERGWSVEALQDVVAGLADKVTALTAAELYTVFQQSGLAADSPEVAGVIQAVTLGALGPADLEDFAQGRRSSVDKVLEDPDRALRQFAAGGPSPVAGISSMPLGTATAPVADETAAEFLVESAAARLLDVAFTDSAAGREAAERLEPGPYTERVRERFLSLVNRAQGLPLPDRWSFRPGGELVEPNLMQRVVAVRVRDERRVGNWSGTGAGKTISALLASRVVDADITVVLCPNAVVPTWVSAINATFPGCWVGTKTLDAPLPGPPSYLVVNYEHLQRPAAPGELTALASSGRVGMVVVDEIHQAKQRDEHSASLRHRNLLAFLADAALADPGLRVLGMSATPVINTLTEGSSLLRLVTGLEPGLDTAPTIANCMALHQQLVSHGLRWMPRYETALDYREVPVD